MCWQSPKISKISRHLYLLRVLGKIKLRLDSHLQPQKWLKRWNLGCDSSICCPKRNTLAKLGATFRSNSKDGFDNNLNRTGQLLGVGTQANADKGSEIAPPKSDLLTGEYLGKRVTNVALKLFNLFL